MKTLLPALLLSALYMAPMLAQAEVVVIVNLANPLQKLSPAQVSDFFLGRVRVFPDGASALVLEQPRDAETRAEFFRRLNGMSLKQLNAYWARLQFSGEVQPPGTLEDSRAVVAAVRKQSGAIGYADAAAVDASVRVVLRLKD